jgi:predicted deacylase
MYARANLKNDTLAQMAKLLQPDIILDSREASAGIITSASKTLRQEAEEKGIYCVTLEAADPQVIQSDMVKRGTNGILNILSYLNMLKSTNKKITDKAKYCTKSYWIYADKGGFLDVPLSVNQRVKKGEIIAVLSDIFGNEVKKYISPEDGVVIGKSTNPVSAAGARIIQLGIER